MINIETIIRENLIKVYFQPIISPTDPTLVYVESFVRGLDPDYGTIIPPHKLFEAALDQNRSKDFQKACIIAIFKKFKDLFVSNGALYLYLNIEKTFFDDLSLTDFLKEQAHAVSIPCNRVIIDISHLFIRSTGIDYELNFINALRQDGFYISLDDIGRNYHNLDRILYFNPDVIKINLQMFNQLQNSNYKLVLKEYVSDLAHKMGILVISTGVESQEDLMNSLDAGAQLIQGYYIDKPGPSDYHHIETIARNFNRDLIIDKIAATYKHSERDVITNIINFTNYLRSRSEDSNLATFDEKANAIMKQFSFIESGFVIDAKGLQFGQAYINRLTFSNRNKDLFHLYNHGYDHSENELFSQLNNEFLTNWVTSPFISMLSNELCVSTSFRYQWDETHHYIIVLTIDYKHFTESGFHIKIL